MNPIALACPTQQQLAAFLAGKLDAAFSGEIEQHLAECPSCCQLLKLLPDDNTLVSLLRDPRAETAADAADDHSSPGVAPTILSAREQLTTPPGAGATEFAAGPGAGPITLPAALAYHSRYRITRLLGRGGMGDVYQAHHRMMNRTVALKVISAQLVSSPAAIGRFHREVQAAARLSHPNIVTAYDAEQAGDVHFLVMEFVEGTDLASLVQQNGPLPVAQACDFIRQAAEGLQHAHALGLVHRDIKPHNLMVSGGIVKILDFGLASFATESAVEQLDQSPDLYTDNSAPHLTLMGSMMGTPDFMAPEQARDAHSADIRCDIYSLGCTLHFLLTGQPPFSGDTVLDKVTAHVEREPKALSECRADIPPGLDAVVRRMMAKDPAERFQTPADVVAALRSLGALQPAPGRRPSLPVPLAIAATLLAGFFLALAAVIVVVTDRGRLIIQSEVSDVKIVVTEDGKEVETIDLKTGSQVTWLPSGKYELKLVGGDNDVKIDRSGFTMSRLGHAIVTARYSDEGRGVIRAFGTTEPTITRDGVEVAEGGWKLTATAPRTVRLFDTPMPPMKPGPYFYRAKLRSENVTGRAYLEMWSRFPDEGEFFSKGFDKAIKGTNGWAEYEVPFYLKKGEQPDLVRLNVVIEGGGTVWIKDIEVRGRTAANKLPDLSAGAMSETVTTGFNGSFEITKSGLPVIWSFYTPRTVPTGDFDIVMDKTEFKEGEQSLKFVVRKCDSTGGRLSPGFFNEFHVENHNPPGPFETRPGETYKISFWAKNAGSEFVFKARGVSALKGDKGAVIRSKETFDQWRRFECTYTIPPKMWLRLELNVVQPGTFWIDDLQIVRVQEKAAVADEQRLQGKWVAVSAKFRGKELTAEQLARLSITLKGNGAELTDPNSGEAMAGTFTIDGSRSPKHIDFIAPDGKERMPGIFEFDGDRLKVATVDGDYARPTDFEPAQTADHMTAVFEHVPGSAPATAVGDEPPAPLELDETQKEAVKAAEAYLAVMDEGRFGQLRDMAAASVKQSETRDQYSQKFQKFRDTFGKATRRTLESARLLDDPPGQPKGRYANVQYQSNFERVQKSWELLSLVVENDGQWRVVGYAHTLEPLPMPEATDPPRRSAEAPPPPPGG